MRNVSYKVSCLFEDQVRRAPLFSVEYLTNFRPRVRVILRMDEKRKKRKKRMEKRYNRKRSWRLITPDPVVKNLYEKIPMRVG